MTDELSALCRENLERLELFFLRHPLDKMVGQATAETGAAMHEALFVALFEIDRIAADHGISGAHLLRTAADDREAFRSGVGAAHKPEDELVDIVRRYRAKGMDDGLNDGG